MDTEYDAAMSVGRAYVEALLSKEVEEARQQALIVAHRMGLPEQMARSIVDQVVREYENRQGVYA